MFVLVEFKHSDFFYFLQGLFATHQTLSSQCWIFSSWSRSKKIRRLLISKFFFYCFHSNIGFNKNYIFPNFNPYPITNLLCRLDKAKRPQLPEYILLSRQSRPGQKICLHLATSIDFVLFSTTGINRGSQWGGGFYGYRLKFWLFYGYRLIFFSYG